MIKKINFYFLFCFSISVEAQNLIPNGDFELYDGCPANVHQLDSVANWFNPTLNIPTITGTPDYFNQCAGSIVSVPSNNWGYQPARSGVAYAGMYLWAMPSINQNYREYIEVQLTSALQANNCYHFEMYVNLANTQPYTTDDIAVYFSDTIITGINYDLPLPFIPQIESTAGFITDTLNWVLVSGNYIASGGENYLIIGNFKDDASTDTLYMSYPGFVNTTYVYIDDVTLSPCTGIEEQGLPEKIKVFPSITSGIITVQIAGYNSKQQSRIEVYDMAGKLILEKTALTEYTSIDLTEHKSGNYYLRIFVNEKMREWKIVKTN